MKKILIITILLIGFCGFILFSSWIMPRPDVSSKQVKQKAKDYCQNIYNSLPPKNFTSDGCSMLRDEGIRDCCIEHDIKYWCGGSFKKRKAADIKLMKCINSKKGRSNGKIEYWGVRLGGWYLFPLSWRWGYGWNWPEYKAS